MLQKCWIPWLSTEGMEEFGWRKLRVQRMQPGPAQPPSPHKILITILGEKHRLGYKVGKLKGRGQGSGEDGVGAAQMEAVLPGWWASSWWLAQNCEQLSKGLLLAKGRSHEHSSHVCSPKCFSNRSAVSPRTRVSRPIGRKEVPGPGEGDESESSSCQQQEELQDSTGDTEAITCLEEKPRAGLFPDLLHE